MVSARNCIIPLTTLRTTFSLTIGSAVIAKARAKNAIGYGQYSQPNTNGALIQTEPGKMNTPTNGTVTLSSIEISWAALTTST
jgi:hypothetical protein